MTTIAENFDADRLNRVRSTLRQQIDDGYIHGAAMRVTHRGRPIVDVIEGYADKATERRLEPDAVFTIMSTSKPMTNVLALSLVERGLLRLHTPVAEVIPEFAMNGKADVNLFHLMTHTSGVVKALPPFDIITDVEAVTAWAAAQPPDCRPGERVDYSLVAATAIIATMCLRVDGRGRDYPTMLAEDIFEPLGMTDTCLGGRADLLKRHCPVVTAQVIPGALEMDDVSKLFIQEGAAFAAGGVISTIGDLHRWTEMLRRGGELDGCRVISPAMLDFCARAHTDALRDTQLDGIRQMRRWPEFHANIGIGFRVRGHDGVRPGPFGLLNSPSTFGHFGAGSTGTWVDPVRELAFTFLSTGLLEESYSMERTSMLSDLVVSAMA